MHLLRERAWSREHVRWALTQPIVLYSRALSQLASGLPARELGRSLQPELDDWTCQFPIEPFWGALSAAQARAELKLCEEQLLRSRTARRRFRTRLAARFPGVTAVEQACATALEGGS